MSEIVERSMAGYTHTCARCGTEMSVHERYLGRTLRCTGCRSEFVADPTGTAGPTDFGGLPEAARHTCTACGTEMTIARRYYGRTLRCTECGEEFTARLPVVVQQSAEVLTESTPVAVVEAPAPDPAVRARRTRIIVVSAVLIAVLSAMLWYLGGDRDEGFGSFLFRAEKGRAQSGELRFGDGATILVALDRDRVGKLLELDKVGDDAFPVELAQSPGYIPVVAGTRVRVLERRRRAEARVRILDGPQNSRVVWVPFAWVR